MANADSQTGLGRHLVITVHGIRTFGEWQHRLETSLKRVLGSRVTVHSIDYGYFSVIAFFLPFVRWLATRRIRKLLLESFASQSWDRIDIVAHSFGTHLVGWSLKGLSVAERKSFRVHTLILAGSVLHPRFPWPHLLDRRSGCVGRLVNDCGTKDAILILSQVCVPRASMAGRVGFRGVLSDHFRNRYFTFGHSGYFITDGRPNDFMERWWVPLLTTDAAAVPHDERQASSIGGAITFLINNAEFFKLAGYAFCGYLIYAPINNLVVERERARQAELVVSLADSALAMNLETQDPTLAILLARQAYVYNERFKTGRMAIVDRALRKVLGAPFLSRTLLEHRGDLTAADISPDAQWLAVSSDQGTVWIWSLEDMTQPPTVLTHSGGLLRALAFRKDSSRLLGVSDSAEVVSWEIPPRERLTRQATKLLRANGVLAMALSRDNEWVAGGFADGKVSVWKWKELPSQPSELCCHGSAVTALAFHPHLPILATASTAVRIWEWNHRQPLLWESQNIGSSASVLAWSHKGRQLGVGTKGSLGKDGAVLVRTVLGKPAEWQKIGTHNGSVAGLQFASDDTLVISVGSGDRTAQFTKLKHGAVESVARLRRHQNPPTTAVVDPKGRYLVTYEISNTLGVPSKVLLWSLARAPAMPLDLDYHEGAVSLRFAPRGATLASIGMRDNELVLYDVDRERILKRLQHGEATPETLAFHADGRTVATGTRSRLGSDEDDFKVRLFPVEGSSLDPIATLVGHKSGVSALSFSPDGRWLASAAYLDDSILLWDLNAKPIVPMSVSVGENQVTSLAFDPRSTMLAWAGMDNVIRRKTLVPDAIAFDKFRGHKGGVTSLAYSPDGARLISGGRDGVVWVWEAGKASRAEAQRTQGAAVTDIAVDPNGKAIASGGEDGKVRLWDLASGSKDFQELDGPGTTRTSVTFSADDRFIAAGGANGKIRVWPTARHLADLACLFANRNLTENEWSSVIAGSHECTCPRVPCVSQN